MDEELLNILSGSHHDIDNQKLLDYLNDKLSSKEKHEFEKKLLDSEIESDAIEGLSQFSNKEKPQAYAEELNRKLRQQLQRKKTSKVRRRIRDLRWTYAAIALVILIILVAFIIISKFLK